MPKPKLKFRIKANIEDLERTSRGKYICPLCGTRGYGNYWWSMHRIKPHVQCICGTVVLANGLKRHQTMKECTSA